MIEKNRNNNNILYLLPKYEKYMEYMIDNVVSKLPRIEKFNIGNEIKISMFESVKYILILSKVDKKLRLGYLNMLDANICVQRIYVRIMYKRRYLDTKRYMYIMEMLAEIYNNIYINSMICIFGNVTNINNNYLINSEEIYIFT